jgi:nucleoside phosphorylase
MIHIFTALYSEAKPLIEFYNLKRDFEVTHFQHFKSEKLTLSITGVGGIKASTILSYFLGSKKDEENSFCLLIGVCGTKNRKYEIGEIFLINKAIQHSTKKCFYPDILFPHSLKENSIESFENVVDSTIEVIEENLVDMEAAFFLEAAQLFLSPHRTQVLKIVSDYLEIKNITKEFISKLVERRIEEIDLILKALKSFDSCSTDVVLPEEKIALENLFENLKLTYYMKKELYDLYRIAKVKNNISFDSLSQFLSIKVSSKLDREKVYERIKSLLQTYIC